MNAYIYAADLWCEGCGAKLREELPAPEGADPEDEYTFNSDDYPKYAVDGGGEADSPQHCAAGADCVDAIELPTGDRIGAWLENDLTPDGVEYVVEAIQEAREDSADTPHARYRRAVTALWAGWYAEYDVVCDAMYPPEPETEE